MSPATITAAVPPGLARALAAMPAPSLLDRLVGYFSPQMGLQRMRARAGLALATSFGGGGYNAGRSDRTALKEYRPGIGSADADLNPGLDSIRARSRDQARNNPIATGALNTIVTSTVGTGLACQPQVDREALGLTDEQADAWEGVARRVWEAWAECPECDIEEELNFYQLQDLAFRSVLESGDVLRLRRFMWDGRRRAPKYGSFATKVQLVEADRVSNPNFGWDTDRLSSGVELDADGRTVMYWVQVAHPGDPFRISMAGRRWIAVPARSEQGERIAQLLFHKRRPGQRRGVPHLAPVIETLLQCGRYTEAELMAAVLNSFFTVFLKSDGSSEPALGLVGVNETDEEAAASAATPMGPKELRLGSGLMMELDPGEDVTFADPKRPSDAFDPFMTAMLRQVGAAIELPYEVLVKHFQSSYSASRAAILEAYKFFLGRRQWLVDVLCQPAYEDVISEAVARGILQAPGFFDSPLIRRAWLGTAWTGDAMPQLDPLKEVAAAKMKVDECFSTRDREAMAMNGSSFGGNLRQRAKEERMRRDAELIPTAAAADPDPAEPTNREDPPDALAPTWSDRTVAQLVTAAAESER
ncbi:MAG: phage portal protein [Vicinamibacterales bacterium]